MGRLRRRLEPNSELSYDELPSPTEMSETDIASLEQQILQEQQLYQQQQEAYQAQQFIPNEYQQPVQQFPAQLPPQQQDYQMRGPPPPSPPHHQMSVPMPPKPVKDYDSPLSILDKIKNKPSSKGTFPISIGGRPVDLHVLEDYITKISPFALKTILRYHNAKTIEEMKGYSKGHSLKISGSTIMLILLAVGMGILGIIVMIFMPEIMSMFQGGAGLAP